jgi:hypothetical protein
MRGKDMKKDVAKGMQAARSLALHGSLKIRLAAERILPGKAWQERRQRTVQLDRPAKVAMPCM